jgi:ferredoxin
MNEQIKINPLNASGKYFVDQEKCLNHGCCVKTAPHCFKMDEKVWSAYVYKQPETEEEETECLRAVDCCPEGAVFDCSEQSRKD